MESTLKVVWCILSATEDLNLEANKLEKQRRTSKVDVASQVEALMSKSGTSSNVISLPKGGGALNGIGEKFGPDLHTGTGNFTVPIAIPPGRNGFQPELNLVYSTGLLPTVRSGRGLPLPRE